MKRVILILILAVVILNGAFTQESESIKNWISGEIGIPLGVCYERVLNNHFSVGALVFHNIFQPFGVYEYTGVQIIGRWYPWARRFYAEIGLGFARIRTSFLTYSGEHDYWLVEDGIFVAPEVGWKIDLGIPGSFFINPTLGLVFPFNRGAPLPRIALGIGYAF